MKYKVRITRERERGVWEMKRKTAQLAVY